MLTPGTVIDLTIEKPAAGGRMVARHEGQVVLVHAAIPGERVRAVVERVSQGVAYATAMDVVEASPDRRAASTRLGMRRERLRARRLSAATRDQGAR